MYQISSGTGWVILFVLLLIDKYSTLDLQVYYSALKK